MAKNPCKYLIEIKKGEFKEFTEAELKDYLLGQDLSKLKPIKDAVQERTAEEKVPRPTSAGENIPEGGEGVRPSKQRAKAAEKGEGDEEGLAITRAANDLRRQELGLGEYEKGTVTWASSLEKAQNLLEQGYNPKKLIAEIESGKKTTTDEVETQILGIYLATLKEEISKNPSNLDDLLLEEINVRNLLDMTGEQAGRNLQIRQVLSRGLESLSDFYIDEMGVSGVDKLTDAQKEKARKDYEEYKKSEDSLEKKIQDLENKNRELLAEKEYNSIKRSTPKVKKDYKKERSEVVDSIKDKLKKIRTGEAGLMATPVPYAAELIAISPDIAKLVKSFAAEGIEKLSEVVVKIHDLLKDEIKGLTEKDVRDAIAGKYNKPKASKNDLDRKVFLLKREAELLSNIESALAKEPREEKAKIEKNQNIKKLEDELKSVRQKNGYYDDAKIAQAENAASKNIIELKRKLEENDLEYRKAEKTNSPKLEELRKEQKALREELDKRRKEEGIPKRTDKQKLDAARKRIAKEINDTEEKLKNKDFEDKIKSPSFLENPELKDKYKKEYDEYLELVVKKRDIRHQYELEKARELAKNLSSREKRVKFAKEFVNTIKAIKSGVDDSFVGVQAGLAIMANPVEGMKAYLSHWKDFYSEGRFKKGLAEVYENKPLIELVQEAGLDILDPQKFEEGLREEAFGGTNLLQKELNVGGKKIMPSKFTTAPFERLYISMGNNIRLNIFLKLVDEAQGRRVNLLTGRALEGNVVIGDNKLAGDAQLYKDFGRIVNELTGRGKVHPKLEDIKDKLSWVIWSPQLLSSTINLLGVGDVGNFLLGGKKGYYRSLTPEAREVALYQTVKGISMGIAIMAAFSLNPDKEVDSDPKSVTFGQVKDNLTGMAYNVFGRFTSVIRYIMMMITGERRVDEQGEKISGGQESWKFFRGKFNPIAGIASDALITKKTFDGKPYQLSDLPADLFLPISLSDVKKGLEQDGSISLLTRGIPSFHGLKVMNERDFIPANLKELLNKNMTSAETVDKYEIKNNKAGGRAVTDEEFKDFAYLRDSIIKEELTDLYEFGGAVLGHKGLKPYSEITNDELKDLVKEIKSFATSEAKAQLFGAKVLNQIEARQKAELQALKAKRKMR